MFNLRGLANEGELIMCRAAICRRCRETLKMPMAKEMLIPSENPKQPSIEVKDSLSAIDNLTEELSRLDIASDFSPSSSQDTQYNTEESESQVPREDSKAQESNENRKTDALDIFLDESSIGPLGSILRHPWGDTSTKTRLHYTTKASAIIAEVVRTVAPQSAAASSGLQSEILTRRLYK
ncbi:hypothetical protein QZH41_010196 [Actinostola sp. cb2023]|nr:hypothetical protein QZH41_010196 [Actinostola sp. cb2023]